MLKTISQAKQTVTAPANAAPAKRIIPPKMKVVRGNQQGIEGINMLIFGTWGSGKTYTIKALLEAGYKVLYLNTDLGGNGLKSFTIPMRAEGKVDLLENLAIIPPLEDVDDFVTFVDKPESVFPDIYTFDPDFIFWDGLHGFQQFHIAREIADLETKDGIRTIEDEFSVSGKEWQLVRNATLNSVHKFLKLNNKMTGKVWHRIITCQEDVRNAKNEIGSDPNHRGVEQKVPLIQGQAKQLMAGAFDLIIRTKKDNEGKYRYVFSGRDNSVQAKKRGFDLPDEMPADFGKLWETLAKQDGIVRDAKNETYVQQES